MTTRSKGARRRGGFTLIEVMISLTILSLMLVMAWTTTNSSSRAAQNFSQIQVRNHEIRVATARIVRDFSSAYLSSNEDMSMTERRTMFIGKSSGSVDEVRFSTLAHRTLWASARESEQTLVAYLGHADREDPGKTNLIRWESRRLSNERWESEPAEVDVLIHDIEEFRLEYYDWRDDEWKERWDSVQPDAERGRLPFRVRVTIVILNERGKEVTYTTTARISLREELKVVL